MPHRSIPLDFLVEMADARPQAAAVSRNRKTIGQEASSMLYTVHYPREIMVDRVVFDAHDQNLIALCRGTHNRLGFAYQMGFVRLTGRFPAQQPLEILDDLLAFVAHEVDLDAT
jgi:Domain of unknown function (DUF4158)